MAPPSRPAWRKLRFHHKHQPLEPGLFFKLIRYDDDLALQVTDLIHLWTAAQTSREDLKKQAVQTRCSIDPSDDDEQYEVLVAKLEDAVSAQHQGSKVQLSGRGWIPDAPSSSSPSPPPHFELSTSTPLPPPLSALEWTFHMERQDPSVLTRELLLPALLLVEAGRRREDDLRRLIKEKDYVIGRLMDKMEGLGVDLAMVFPGFAGKRVGLSAKQAGRVVPGMEDFAGEVWEGRMRGGDAYGVGGIVDALRDGGAGELVWKGRVGTSVGLNGDASGDEENGLGEKTREIQQKSARSVSIQGYDFENPESSDESTGVLNRSSSSNPSPIPKMSREVSSKPQASKLGSLGGRKTKSRPDSKERSPAPPPSPPTEATRKLSPASTSDTATESESDSHRPPPRPKDPTPKKLTTRMRIVGGRKPQNNSSKEQQIKSPEPSAPLSQTTPSQRISRLGAIGGRKEKAASPIAAAALDHDSTASPSPSPSPSPSHPLLGSASAEQSATGPEVVPKRSSSPSKAVAEEPLTEAERANRKRLELKRQLDQGAGRKKKRRRF